MKTSELIKQLQEADPSGEEEVCVGNADIHFVESLPAWYDGSLQVLQRDPEKKGYNIVGGKYKRTGRKIQIHTLSIHDVVFENTGAVIDYSELDEHQRESAKKAHQQLQKFCDDLKIKHEWEHFLAWAKKKASSLTQDLENFECDAWRFFEQNIDPRQPIPKDIPVEMNSYSSRREIQWGREISISLKEGFLEIEKSEAKNLEELRQRASENMQKNVKLFRDIVEKRP